MKLAPPKAAPDPASQPTLTLVSPPARPVDDVQTVWAAWQQATGRHKAKLDDKRRAKIRAALKSHGLADTLAAVQGWKHDPWPDRARHNDVTVLLRDADHIEKFADLWQTPPAPAARPGRPMPPRINPDDYPDLPDLPSPHRSGGAA